MVASRKKNPRKTAAKTKRKITRPNVLYYAEAHPIRNSFTEHYHVCKMLGPVLSRFAAQGKISLRIFSNQHVAEQIKTNMPGTARNLVEPTTQEAEFIQSQFGRWNPERISTWLDLVSGVGEVADFYMSVLERIHAEDPIDIVMLWSENGGVRNFCERHDIPILHGELGPTRPPFVETMYFDSTGTNGNASARTKAREGILKALSRDGGTSVPSARSWLLSSERALTTEETTSSLLDLPVTFRPNLHQELPEAPYVFIALQLADDLNTLLHSSFRDPQAFLSAALKDITDKGYIAVIKGHPGAGARPYNLRKEVEALEYVKQAYPESVILPRTANVAMSNFVLGNARYSMSINSSVSFESLLLGVPSVLLGAAYFDADGWMQENFHLEEVDNIPDYRDAIDAITSTYLGHHLVPKHYVLGSDYLLKQIYQLVGLSSADHHWDHTNWHILGPEHLDTQEEVLSPPTQSVTSIGKYLFQGTITFTEENGAQFLSDGTTHLDLQTLTVGVVGTIDTVVKKAGGIKVSGWCLDKRNMKRPLKILAVCDGVVQQGDAGVVERYDVHSVFPDAETEAFLSGFELIFPENTAFEGLTGLLIISEDMHAVFVTTLRDGAPIIQGTGKPDQAGGNRLLRRILKSVR